ncbi:hypothetical protein DF141_17515, partial [Burkholderia cenocepacia]
MAAISCFRTLGLLFPHPLGGRVGRFRAGPRLFPAGGAGAARATLPRFTLNDAFARYSTAQ